ncbi:hypothetical protein GMLC_03880 [Geomonas limicola]|uniref:STAS/SEC14 domain-containing protein n=1 Tax=Geomonas limicola TaxID=2740186 RepID=A0A6V8N693_9BACT|nr:hypothetical protein GMLC_03880 [Geomonas limicola]
MTCEEVLNELRLFYQGEPTKFVIWIVPQGALLQLNGGDLRRIADFVKDNLQGREEGKTAFVAEATLAFGFGRMLNNLGEAKEIPVSTKTFRSIDEALEWLGLDALPMELGHGQGTVAGEVGASTISATR